MKTKKKTKPTMKKGDKVSIQDYITNFHSTGTVVNRAVKDASGEQLWVVQLDVPVENRGEVIAIDLFKESVLTVMQ